MQALADRATRGKLAPLTSLHRRERWHSATYAIERVSKEIAATDPETGMRKGTISGFRDAVVAVGDLAGRLGILSVMWDELREGVSKLQSERGDRNGEVEIWPLSKRVRNQEGKREGTTKRKVIGDLRGYLGIKVMMEELTEAAEMANGAAGKRMVWSWDVNIDDENYVSGDDEEEDEGDVEGEEEIQDLGDQDEDMEIA
ncbi:hypothetical protein E6O75_ATG05695 [Venturia nashicola]|uniref:Uncharacterized protein n=1 Tax=Venturia nashicola TaxID=86259 RepID=A0A4Z1PE17_9PEZI|nr:hypothetical protein E6O75_ATG05695 [Venturia nashicola]